VTTRRQALADDLRGALHRGELELYYQPQVRIDDREVIGHEALLRWKHPVLGMVSPAEFIPIAEQTGLIVEIGDWTLQTACLTAATWPPDWRVAVNLSPLQLRQSNLADRVAHALAQSGLAPERLELELTESLLLDDRARAQTVLGSIRALKVRLALDDFGVGYSSMDVLRHFPFDKIKLDKTFVDDIEANPQSLAILRAMLAMGRSLSIAVLAEGVETERQLSILQAEGCVKVQGYLTGRPVSADKISFNPPQRRAS
jgi:EAL domain-containing protein (putative c-di-GMP-specific phosphodiesterase class I)